MTLLVLTALTFFALQAPDSPQEPQQGLTSDSPAATRAQLSSLVVLGDPLGPDELPDPRLRLQELALKLAALGPDDATARVRLLLASANVRLAIDAEPFASRFLLEIQSPDDLRDWNTAATQALTEIVQARQTLDSLPDPATERDRDHLDSLQDATETLESFARLYLALTRSPENQERDALSKAAIDLASLLESENRPLAKAATLWQATTLRRIDRPDRAFDLLDKPLSAPGPELVALFNRLERIRCLADLGDLQPALVLALRMEEACDRWYRDERKEQQTRRACTLLRSSLCRTALRNAADSNDPQWTQAWNDICARIDRALLEEDRPQAVARLGALIPILDLETEDSPDAPPSDDPPETEPLQDELPEAEPLKDDTTTDDPEPD